MHCLHFSLSLALFCQLAFLCASVLLSSAWRLPGVRLSQLMAPQGLGTIAPHFIEEVHGLPKALWQ